MDPFFFYFKAPAANWVRLLAATLAQLVRSRRPAAGRGGGGVAKGMPRGEGQCRAAQFTGNLRGSQGSVFLELFLVPCIICRSRNRISELVLPNWPLFGVHVWVCSPEIAGWAKLTGWGVGGGELRRKYFETSNSMYQEGARILLCGSRFFSRRIASRISSRDGE